MYRSASTLQFQITTQLVEEAQLGQAVGWIDADRFTEVRHRYRNRVGMNVVKVHKCTDSMITEFIHQNAVGIYTFRDIRDVYASMMKQRQKSFEFLWNEGFLLSCLENYQRWTTLPNVLVSKYQNIIENVDAEVKRIATHLRVPIDDHTCHAIAHNYTLEAQQARVKHFRETLAKLPQNPNDHREIVDYHDDQSLLHMNHIDSVKVGRWQTDLSPAEARSIEQQVAAWCQTTGYAPATFLSESAYV